MQFFLSLRDNKTPKLIWNIIPSEKIVLIGTQFDNCCFEVYNDFVAIKLLWNQLPIYFSVFALKMKLTRKPKRVFSVHIGSNLPADLQTVL